MHKICMSKRFDECPIYWQNFIDSLRNQETACTIIDEVKLSLKSHNGYFCKEDNLPDYDMHSVLSNVAAILFENAEDATAFMLKWS